VIALQEHKEVGLFTNEIHGPLFHTVIPLSPSPCIALPRLYLKSGC